MTDQQTGAAAGDDAGRRSPLHDEHVALGANLTTFGGWLMPLRYTSDLAEHRAVREAAGLFDLSHMGEIEVAGPQAAAALDHALVGNLSAVAPGRARYTMICQEDGAVLDDLVVYRLAQERFLVVANAGNADLVARELVARAEGFDATVTDQGAETALVAVQGPRAEEIVAGLTDPADPAAAQAVRDLRYYAAVPLALRTDTGPVDALVARTGYTGEDGFELFVPADRAADLWRTTLAAGAPLGLVPAGLSARDSLRLEAGMPLYGHELDTTTTPYEAGLGRVVKLDKVEADGSPLEFVGRAALAARRTSEPARVLVGLQGLGRRPARAGYAVVLPDAEPGGAVGESARRVGTVTSGAPSPTLGHPIALAYVTPELSAEGTRLAVDVRGRAEPVVVVPLPFYRRPQQS
ncbi:glycine cleavage system aminomethyltransferase GcvT [Cellulosimicrobium sp. BIT-GX5]|uniref:Aminomethyltransferase n=1 Tax=Cellulosimicrobium composti TaxID=2672572 RepID=A0A6N7ZG14_9MICO|nr:glycine cleavage system aminomethyltransferase GcvT [Cellulosimicrobium composti]MTG88262.1 glycine cleavage system aminomethyltransferase GcvT [Cellulosimicrobium composti]NDO88560.1 glycine cleavage system aminomethyltransferase GcvT [Cellulosimicrobium composti]